MKIDMAKAEYVAEIKGLGKAYRCFAPFDEQLKAFREVGIRHPISVRDTAYARLQGNLMQGTRTAHAPIYAPNENGVLVRTSPLVTNLRKAKKATQSHRGRHYFTQPLEIYEKVVEQAEKDSSKEPEKRKAVVLPSRQNFDVDRDSEIARFLFQDTREEYFDEFRKGNNICFYNLNQDTIDSQEGAIVNYLWFGSTDYDSVLDGDNWSLRDAYRTFGVLRDGEDICSQKFVKQQVESYTPAEIRKVLKNLKISGLEKQIISQLRK